MRGALCSVSNGDDIPGFKILSKGTKTSPIVKIWPKQCLEKVQSEWHPDLNGSGQPDLVRYLKLNRVCPGWEATEEVPGLLPRGRQ